MPSPTPPSPSTPSLHSAFSRSRLVAELQLGMRQVAGPTVNVGSSGATANGGSAGTGGGGGGEAKRREDEDVVALLSAFSTFNSLSHALQAECLLFFLSDGALLGELVRYFLTPSSGQANDVVCQWLYDVHWQAFHSSNPSSASGIVITTLSSSPPPASLFLLHLVPVLVFSFLYRNQRGLPRPGGGRCPVGSLQRQTTTGGGERKYGEVH